MSKLTTDLLAHLLYHPTDISPHRAKLQTIADAFGEMNQIVVYRPTKEEALAAIQRLLRREAWAKEHPREDIPGDL
jgi:hypothetical protein